jgi:ABC-type glycerol-3-phosphate transport system permease component
MHNARLANTARIVVVGVTAVLIFLPVYWVIAASFMPSHDLLSSSLIGSLPLHPTLQNYVHLLTNPQFNFGSYYLNSLFVASITALLCLICSTLGGYALARLQFPGRAFFGNVVLIAYVVPGTLLVVPIYSIMVSLHMLNTRTSVIVTYLTFSLPFSLWMMRGYFSGLPREIEEAAQVDGASILGALFRVILPLAKPGLVAVAMFSFLGAWNEFLFALVFLNNPDARTLPVGLTSTFVSPNMGPSDWSNLMAASVLAAIPVLILFAALQRFLVEGLSAGAVKN